MPKITVTKCDGCGVLEEDIGTKEEQFDFTAITQESKQVQIETDKNWLVTARPIPTDPVGITHEYHCPECNPHVTIPDEPLEEACPECGTEGTVENRKWGLYCYQCSEYVEME